MRAFYDLPPDEAARQLYEARTAGDWLDAEPVELPEPLNDYEEACAAAARQRKSWAVLTPNERRQLVLAWLEQAQPETVQEHVGEAVASIPGQEHRRYIEDLMRGVGHGAYQQHIVLMLEVSLAPVIDHDIANWRNP